eukprot:3007868-Pyramimonas_sp.AAC.1
MSLTAALQQELDALVPRLSELVARFGGADEDAKQQKTECDEILELLVSKNLAYYVVFENDAVGIHSDNRYGDGVQVDEVHSLILRIVNVGFSFSALGSPRAFE